MMRRTTIITARPLSRRWSGKVVLAPAMAFLLGCAGSLGESDSATYTSARYGFALEYPDTLDLQEHTPAYIDLGRRDEEMFSTAVQIAVEMDDGANFQANAKERARAACAADGPDLSLQCTEVEAQEAVTTADGLEGIAFYLRHLATRPGTGVVVETGTRGPFYAFRLPMVDSGETSAVLFIRAPVVLPPEEVDRELIHRVARSVRLH